MRAALVSLPFYGTQTFVTGYIDVSQIQSINQFDSEAHLELSRTSTVKLFCKNQLTAKSPHLFSQKISIVDVGTGSKYPSDIQCYYFLLFPVFVMGDK